MRRIAAALLALAVLLTPTPARACDPYWDWCGYDDWYDPYWDLPAYEEPSWSWWDAVVYEPAPVYVYEPAPVYVYEPAPIDEPVPAYELVYVPAPAPPPAPAWSDPVVWTSPGSDMLDATTVAAPAPPPITPIAVAPSPDPVALAAAAGRHMVTEVWTSDIVSTQGTTTTYSSTTASAHPGTSAELVASVATGEASPYDALLFNRRTSLTDGRAVKGDVYANYVWNGYDWVFDKYVFFQDDLELARLAQTPIPTPPPASIQPPSATPPPSTAPAAVPTPVPTASPMPAYVAPVTGDVPPASTAGSPPSPVSQPRPRTVRAGIALAPQADPLGRIEVLRGRLIPLWVRATVDGVPVRVTRWQLVSGDVLALGPFSGTGDEPLMATWRSIPAVGGSYTVHIRATVDVDGEGPRDVDAAIDVVVRAPALVE